MEWMILRGQRALTMLKRKTRRDIGRRQQLLLEHAHRASQVAAALVAVAVGISNLSFGLAFLGMESLVASLGASGHQIFAPAPDAAHLAGNHVDATHSATIAQTASV
jgi:hypothetical protein